MEWIFTTYDLSEEMNNVNTAAAKGMNFQFSRSRKLSVFSLGEEGELNWDRTEMELLLNGIRSQLNE